MVLIADAGSTKTDWLFVQKNKTITTLKSAGLNPVVITTAEINLRLSKAFEDFPKAIEVEKVHFFGAGCWNEANCTIIRTALQKHFPSAEIEVASDIVGAVRASCGDQAGIVCILGTGSNTCLFDGEQMRSGVPSLGYILGDEGSGMYLGKQLIKHYFYRELPKELHRDFKELYQLDKEELIQKVYREKGANQYLASFVPFLFKHRQHPFIQQLLKQVFTQFIERHILKYKEHRVLPIHFIGSIAFHFKLELSACLTEKELKLGQVLKRPIEALLTYYKDRQLDI